jgi:hypothetical protein
MMQSEFNFDVWFVIYRFLKLQITLDENAITTFEFFYMHTSTHPYALQHLPAAALLPPA